MSWPRAAAPAAVGFGSDPSLSPYRLPGFGCVIVLLCLSFSVVK